MPRQRHSPRQSRMHRQRLMASPILIRGERFLSPSYSVRFFGVVQVSRNVGPAILDELAIGICIAFANQWHGR
jgi:hypothetical protein